MERSIQKNGLINALLLLLAGGAGFAVARSANSLAAVVCVVFLGVGFIVALVSWFQMRLEDREKLERLEMEELARSRGSATLFETQDEESFPARNSRIQFERFFVPIFTVGLCLLQGAAVWLLWRWLAQSTLATELKQPMLPLFYFGVLFFVLFLRGKFSSTYARLGDHRLLRPSAGYLLLGAYLSVAVVAGVVLFVIEFKRADLYVARALCCLLGLVTIETLVNLILEIYRPRVKGKVERPLYESRLVGLLGRPEGLVTTAAQALDYQFGFKVSETWFYRLFVERALAWFFILQLAVLFLSTGIVFIDAGEQGLLEHAGRPKGVLEPGAHLKWPWPVDKVYRFRTEQIQSFEVGTSPDAARQEGPAVLWTVVHTKEDNFLVANRGPSLVTTNETDRQTPPVSLLTGTFPIQYQITNLTEWAYNNEDAPSLLQDLADREIVRFLAGVDMNEVMSYGRLDAAESLRSRIQAAADERKLGARVLSVGLQDLHPPVKVAPDYEKVVAATQTRLAKILAARADEIRTNALAGAQAVTLVNDANADRFARQVGSVAKAALFTNQIPAYKAAPSVYVQRAYLHAFLAATANARKYILLTTNTHNVIVYDLQQKIREDLLGSSVNPNAKK